MEAYFEGSYLETVLSPTEAGTSVLTGGNTHRFCSGAAQGIFRHGDEMSCLAGRAERWLATAPEGDRGGTGLQTHGRIYRLDPKNNVTHSTLKPCFKFKSYNANHEEVFGCSLFSLGCKSEHEFTLCELT